MTGTRDCKRNSRAGRKLEKKCRKQASFATDNGTERVSELLVYKRLMLAEGRYRIGSDSAGQEAINEDKKRGRTRENKSRAEVRTVRPEKKIPLKATDGVRVEKASNEDYGWNQKRVLEGRDVRDVRWGGGG